MKTFFFSACLVLSNFVFAQPNNPQSGFGTNYFRSVNAIVADIKANGLKGTDQVSLDYYKKYLHFEGNITPELATAEYTAYQQTDVLVNDRIAASNFSSAAKEMLTKIIAVPTSGAAMYYASLAEDISNQGLSQAEATLLLQLNDIAYAASTDVNNRIVFERPPTEVPCGGPTGNSALCVVIAAAVGFVIGSEICPVCGAVGAVVFGVVTAILVC